jgi:hypothetical protein
MLRRAPAVLTLVITTLTVACAPAADATDDNPGCPGGKCDGDGTADDTPDLCVAIRGNGPRITAHFAALARIVEHYGLVDGVAGGSSGSLSAFLLESIQMSPQVARCGDRACTPDEAAARAAFLLKSLRGYFEALAASDEGLAFAEVARVAARVRAAGLPALAETDPQAALAALDTLLRSPELRSLVNPELLELLAESPDPAFHVRDIAAALEKGLAFEATAPDIFVRPGVVDFDAFVDKVGRVGSFYAGYGPYPAAEMEALLAACAAPARGKPWDEVAALPAGGTTCGARFRALVAGYRAELRAAAPGAFPSRLDDAIGAHLHALVTTAVLEGDAVATWRAARAAYRAAEPVGPLWTIDYDDVRVGYWGSAADLARLEENAMGFTDLKTRKRRSLGPATWREALAYSPAEPGLARGLELPDGRVSVGGWSDLQPVLALENLGCEKVVFLTRRGGAGSFETGVAGLLGVTADDARALWRLDDPASSYHRALSEAAGVWCTDWDGPPAEDLAAMSAVGYDAPFETRDPLFTEGADPSGRRRSIVIPT